MMREIKLGTKWESYFRENKSKSKKEKVKKKKKKSRYVPQFSIKPNRISAFVEPYQHFVKAKIQVLALLLLWVCLMFSSLYSLNTNLQTCGAWWTKGQIEDRCSPIIYDTLELEGGGLIHVHILMLGLLHLNMIQKKPQIGGVGGSFCNVHGGITMPTSPILFALLTAPSQFTLINSLGCRFPAHCICLCDYACFE